MPAAPANMLIRTRQLHPNLQCSLSIEPIIIWYHSVCSCWLNCTCLNRPDQSFLHPTAPLRKSPRDDEQPAAQNLQAYTYIYIHMQDCDQFQSHSHDVIDHRQLASHRVISWIGCTAAYQWDNWRQSNCTRQQPTRLAINLIITPSSLSEATKASKTRQLALPSLARASSSVAFDL